MEKTQSDKHVIIGSYNTAKIVLFEDNTICIDHGNFTVNYRDTADMVQNCTTFDEHIYAVIIEAYIRDYR